MVRELRVGWFSEGKAFWVFATCNDRTVHMLLSNVTKADISKYLISGEDAVKSDAYAELIDEHKASCMGCRTDPIYVLWEGPPVTSAMEVRLH